MTMGPKIHVHRQNIGRPIHTLSLAMRGAFEKYVNARKQF